MFTNPVCLCVLAAFICTLLSGMGYRPPLWIGVLLLCIAMLISCFR